MADRQIKNLQYSNYTNYSVSQVDSSETEQTDRETTPETENRSTDNPHPTQASNKTVGTNEEQTDQTDKACTTQAAKCADSIKPPTVQKLCSDEEFKACLNLHILSRKRKFKDELSTAQPKNKFRRLNTQGN